jgi:hypothetical protein
MNIEELVRDKARKAADFSQFKSNHIYDHKSYEDGFYEGMMQSFCMHNVVLDITGGFTCDNCGCHPNVIYTTVSGRFCERCKPSS